MNPSEWSSLARRATREAVRETLRSGIPVTDMVDGVVRVIYPTDVVALELLKDEPAKELPPQPAV